MVSMGAAHHERYSCRKAIQQWLVYTETHRRNKALRQRALRLFTVRVGGAAMAALQGFHSLTHSLTCSRVTLTRTVSY